MMTCIPSSSAVVPASTMRSAQLSPAPNSSFTGCSLARASCTVLYYTVLYCTVLYLARASSRPVFTSQSLPGGNLDTRRV